MTPPAESTISRASAARRLKPLKTFQKRGQERERDARRLTEITAIATAWRRAAIDGRGTACSDPCEVTTNVLMFPWDPSREKAPRGLWRVLVAAFEAFEELDAVTSRWSSATNEK